MTHRPDTAPFRVTNFMAKAGASLLGIAMSVAILFVTAARFSSCFGPKERTAEETSLIGLIVPIDTSLPTHRALVAALSDAWAAAGRTDDFALVAIRSNELNAASLGSGRFLAWEGDSVLEDWAIRGVFAHEVAHDVLSHSRKATELQDLADFFGRALGVIGGAEEEEAHTVERWARKVALPHYSRAQEYVADSVGARLLEVMGYDGRRVMAATLEVLLERYGNTEGGFFDYHPSVLERIAALRRAPKP